MMKVIKTIAGIVAAGGVACSAVNVNASGGDFFAEKVTAIQTQATKLISQLNNTQAKATTQEGQPGSMSQPQKLSTQAQNQGQPQAQLQQTKTQQNQSAGQQSPQNQGQPQNQQAPGTQNVSATGKKTNKNIQPKSPFEDNGKIEDSMPKPTGDTENPRIDSGVFEETDKLGELTESEDYSYVSILGNVSDSEYEDFCAYLETVIEADPQVISAFEEDDWEIILTTADLDDLLFQGQTEGVEGCTYFNQKTIYVHAGQYSYCVVHEIGHYIDYKCNYTSKTSEFETIYKSESANLTEYGQTSATEFFAEVYEYLLLQPTTLTSSCPQAASYVESCADSL